MKYSRDPTTGVEVLVEGHTTSLKYDVDRDKGEVERLHFE